ncbi:hypothetical protein TWF730_010502 [Orbilia blumenaviensis]|uniref:Uncharacterized protein n=1 Tax=Orbilia blumenaviensis TaxID=1796055 RepID=A0AAV9USA2_9PEZI
MGRTVIRGGRLKEMLSRTVFLIVSLLVDHSTSVLDMVGVDIGFLPLMECRLLPWDYTRLEPTGCHSAVPKNNETLEVIRLRTGYPYLEDIPDAIAIYDSDCTKANIRFIIFPYKLEFMTQEVHVLEPEWEDIPEYPEKAKYQVLKEGGTEWRRTFGIKPPLPTNEGDVLYKQDGQWGRLEDEIWLQPVRRGQKPLRESFDLYQRGVGERPSPSKQQSNFDKLNLRCGTLEKEFPNSPDSVLVRPRLEDILEDERYPGRLPNTQSRGEWEGMKNNPSIPQRYRDPFAYGEQPLRYKDTLTEVTDKVDDIEVTSPGFILFKNSLTRSPLLFNSKNTGSNRLQLPNPIIPDVQYPSGFSNSRSKSQVPDDLDWDILRPQRMPRVQDETPNVLGEQLRESAERDGSVSEIPDELFPGEKVRVDMKEPDYDSLLAGLTLPPELPSEFRNGISLSPILPLKRSPPSSPFTNLESSDPGINAIILDSDPDLDSQYFHR